MQPTAYEELDRLPRWYPWLLAAGGAVAMALTAAGRPSEIIGFSENGQKRPQAPLSRPVRSGRLTAPGASGGAANGAILRGHGPRTVPAALAAAPGPLPHWPARTARLAVARIWWAEAGLRADADHRAILGVLRRIQGRGTLLQAAQRASKRTTGTLPPLRPRGSWLATLSENGDRPEGWKECGPSTEGTCSGRWVNHRRGWLNLLGKSRRYIASAPPDPCPGAVAWGNEQDDVIALRRGLVLVKCSEPTLNRYWRRPSPERDAGRIPNTAGSSRTATD